MSSNTLHDTKFSEINVEHVAPTEDVENGNLTPAKHPKVEAKAAAPDWAIWEIAALIGAAVTIAAMCVFLFEFDKAPLPPWAQGLPNIYKHSQVMTVLARHVTIPSILDLFKSAIVLMLGYPLTKALSKLTWLWYMGNETQRLADITTFHKVVKRSWKGAFRLIWILKGKYVRESFCCIKIICTRYLD